MYGLATDDGHRYHRIPSRGSEPGRGWVMVLALGTHAPRRLICLARGAGRFYATSGVKLHEVVSGREGLDIAVEAEPGVSYTIDFIGTRANFNHNERQAGQVTRRAKKSKRDAALQRPHRRVTLKTVHGDKASYRFGRDDLYVRARVTSSKHHPNPSELGDFEQAWVQPTRGPAAPKTTGGQAASATPDP